MPQPAVLLLVRFKSALSAEEATRVMRARMRDFRALEGLQQKYYLRDPESGEVAGLYLWRSIEDLAEYRESDLRATIADAYQIEGEPRIEMYEVLAPLRED